MFISVISLAIVHIWYKRRFFFFRLKYLSARRYIALFVSFLTSLHFIISLERLHPVFSPPSLPLSVHSLQVSDLLTSYEQTNCINKHFLDFIHNLSILIIKLMSVRIILQFLSTIIYLTCIFPLLPFSFFYISLSLYPSVMSWSRLLIKLIPITSHL